MKDLLMLQFPSLFAITMAVFSIPLLLLKKRDRTPASFILVFTLLVAALLEGCDMAAVLQPARIFFWKRSALFAEGLLAAGWFAYSLTVARDGRLAWSQRVLLAAAAGIPAAALAIPSEAFLFPADPADERLLFLRPAGMLFYSGPVLVLILALIQIERTFFTLRAPERWKVKLELLGTAAMMSMLLIYDGQAVLYRVVDMHLVPARAASVVLGTVLIVFSRLRRGGRVEVRVSRQLAFRSIVLLLIGAYLVGLGLVEEGVRRFGHGFERAVVLIVGMAGAVVLLLCLLSEKYNRKLRVLIHKHFYKSKYDYRRQWLACTERIASAHTERELQLTILSLFCETFSAKGALLYLREPETDRFLPAAYHEVEASAPLLEREAPLLQVIGGRGWILDVRELTPEVKASAAPLLEEHRVSFIVPLVFERLEGMILLGEAIDTTEIYNYEDFDLMKTLARQTVSTILNLRLSDQLVASRELAAAGKISAYMLHDLKNLVGNLALVVDNAEVHLEDPEFRRDMLGTLANSVRKMRSLIARLKNLEEKRTLQLELSDLMEVAREAAEPVRAEVRIGGLGVLVRVDREEMGKVILNLLLNALEAGGAPVEVEAGEDSDGPFLSVSDRGCGMSEEYLRRHLFRPFRTTKTGGMGIGLYQCRNIVEAHGGRILVESAQGKGTRFIIRLPAGGVRASATGTPDGASFISPADEPCPTCRALPDNLRETCSGCS